MAIIHESDGRSLSRILFHSTTLFYALGSLAYSSAAEQLQHRSLLPAGIDHRTPQIANITADCASPDNIFISLNLDQPFKGIVYAKGHYGTPECMFVEQQPVGDKTASSSFNFTAPVAQCGRNFADKKRNLKISSVTLMVQQDPLFIDKTDYAREIRCTWTLRFDQVISLKPFVVSEGQKPPDRNEFKGDELSVMMDVKLGRNPFSGVSLGNDPVALGTEMTIVVLVKSDTVDPHSIDVVVRDCQARDVETKAVVPLTSANGCVLQPKLIMPFRITLDVPMPGVALAAYATLQSFKFPDTSRVSLTCNVALCKGSCGIECSATTANNTLAKNDAKSPQLSAQVSREWTANRKNDLLHRTRRDTQHQVVFAEAPPPVIEPQPAIITVPSRRSRQLLGKPVPFNNNKEKNLSIDDVFPFLHDPHFLDMALLRAKRIILDAKTKLHQVQVGQDIMVVADTKANSVENLPIIIDDPLAPRNGGQNQHLEEAADVKLASISGGRANDAVSDVTKCVDRTDSAYNTWIIIAFLLILLLLLLSIIVVLAMFISHYRTEAREAQQKYKLYDTGRSEGRSTGRGGEGRGRDASTPATYYVASTSPTYQLYSSEGGEMLQSAPTAMKTRAPNKPSRVPSLPPPLTPSCLVESQKQQQTFNTWKTHDHPGDVALQLHSADIGQTFACGDVSVASRSLCRSLPSLAGAFHDQQLSLIPIMNEGGFEQQPQYSVMSIFSAPSNNAVERMESMNSTSGTHLLSASFDDNGLLQLHTTRSSPPLPLPPPTSMLYESFQVQNTSAAARDDSRSMISNVTSAIDGHSRLGSVSTFRPTHG